MAEAGHLEKAMARYREALNPDLLANDSSKSGPLWGIMHIYQWRGQFEEASIELKWFLTKNPNKWSYVDKKEELRALIEAREVKSKEPIYRYIDYVNKKYSKALPPHFCDSDPSVRIFYAYDYIGDQEGGIQFAERALKYWEKKSNQDLHRPGNKNPYFLVRRAFEQDKKEGFKGCRDAKPGEVCMGRATKALIQSDYFPW